MDQTVVNDLTTLISLDPSIILQHIRKRFLEDKIYTYIGDILIAVNPYKRLSLYTEKDKITYQTKKDPPHIYWIAEQAFKHLWTDKTKQCIIITGDSGAGKTESTKHILNYLVSMSQCPAKSLVDKLNKVTPLIELFGNASTVLNKNSSRFGKLVEIFYGNDGHLIGGNIQTFILEKSRVVEHGKDEKNFHVFHAFFAGLQLAQLQALYLSDKPNDYRLMRDNEMMVYLNSQSGREQFYSERYDQAISIMKYIGFTEQGIGQVHEILAACILLGNIEFGENEDTGELSPSDMFYVKSALMVLVPECDINDKLTTEFMTAFISKPFKVKDKLEQKFFNLSQANDSRDALIKDLYACLFRAIIDYINESIQGESTQRRISDLSISILDISGFENLQANGFEQLFINITNEKIQQYYQGQIFERENQDYLHEGVDVSVFQYTSNADLLALILKKPGILSILDDQNKLSEFDDEKLLNAYSKELKSAEHYRRHTDELTFIISHYAGDVTYSCQGFLAKNRGTRNDRLCSIIRENTYNDIIKTYFDVDDNLASIKHTDVLHRSLSRSDSIQLRRILPTDDGQPKRNLDKLQRNNKLSGSYSAQYQESLRCLLDKLGQGSPLFVRCIKPNCSQQSNTFDENSVMKQLEAAGILDVTRIRREGYPVRLPLDIFAERYKRLLKGKCIGTTHYSADDLQKILLDYGVTDFKIGKTKIFLKEMAMDQLNAAVENLIHKEELEKQKSMRLRQHRKQGQLDNLSIVNEEKEDIDKTNMANDPLNDKESLTSEDTSTSLPPSYCTTEKAETTTTRRAWDIFRITERDEESYEDVERLVLKFCRLITYFVLFVGIVGKGTLTTFIPLLLASRLRNDDDSKKIPEWRSIATTQLIVCYCTPVGLTFLMSLWKSIFGRVEWCGFKSIAPIAIFECGHIAGTALLLFKILPNCSTMSGVIISLTTLMFPALLNIGKEVIKSRKRNRRWKTCGYLAAISTIIIQIGALICIAPGHYYFSYIIQDNISEALYNDRIWLIIGLILFSLGYFENFVHGNMFVSWRNSVQKSRPKIDLLLFPFKVGLFILLTHYLSPEFEFKLTTSEKGATFFDSTGLMIIHIYSTIWIGYQATIACQLQMQQLAFYISLIAVPWSCFGCLLYFCSYHNKMEIILEGQLVCSEVHVGNWIIPFILLWLSLLFITWHEFIPECNRMDKAERLFVLPMRDSLFPAIGLLLRRKDDYFEKDIKRESRKNKEKSTRKHSNATASSISGKHSTESMKKYKGECGNNRPYIYVCGTMWHETNTEMLQLLKSLFRLDYHRMLCRNAEDIIKKSLEYFDFEIHIIFDDAFCDDDVKVKGQRILNSYVEQLVLLMYKAASTVAKGNIDWNSSPKKITTPYGGQLIWIMPGGTQLICHLKDKEKIRHRKRWSQIMYMYYLLGYKLTGTGEEKDVVGESNRKKNPFARPGTSLLNHLNVEKVKRAQNTFILTLDGDVDFKPKAVELLLDKMKTNNKVGAVCGRIHPIGTGPMVWYQQFEYAIGHWLQKATEHVFGCVMCCPGAFSLFRATAIMDDNVMRMYATPPTEAKHYIQFEQGEDRWLCTLMLQQGWRIDYAASADAWTFAPETFKDFFVQRRRWAPSTLANIIDLLSSWRSTTKSNDNISTPFIFYQFILFASSLLGVGTICMMIAGSLNAVLKISMWYSFVIAVSPVVFFATVCFKCTNDRQIFAAGVMTCLFTIVMVFVTVGMCLNLASEPLYSPNVIFIFEILFIFITSGICHPKEIFCLVHGLLYYLTVPSTFIFLTVYYMCNIHVVTWGTREGPKKPEDDDNEPQVQKVKDSAFVSCLKSIGITALLEETIQLVRQLVGRQLTADDDNEFIETNVPPMGIEPSPNKTSTCRDKNRSKTILQNSDHWKSLDLLGKNSAPKLIDSEKEFWDDILKKYLYPLVENKEKEKEIKDELISLRNNVALGFFLMNFLFALAIIQLQSNEDQLKSFYLLNEYEPLSVAFLFVFAAILAIQFCGMLSHRWGTFLHLISSVELIDRKGDQDINAAIKKAEKLQVDEVDLDDESLSIDMNTEDIILEYPEEETTNIYRQTFRKNFETLTKKNVRRNLLQNQHTRHHGSDSQYMSTDI